MNMSASGVTPRIVNEPGIFPGHFRCPMGLMPDNSILIYLTVAGNSVIPMHVLESDSIASVKLKIQTCKGFVMRKQKLVFEGRELARNESLIRDYGVVDGTVLHLILRLSDLQFITVRTTCGKEFEFHTERSRNFGYVKQVIAKKGKGLINVKDQVLIFNGEKLDDQQLIDDICKNNGAVIHLVVQKSAKVRATPLEKTFELSNIAPTSNERRNKESKDEGEKRWKVKYDVFRVVARKSPGRDFWLEPINVNPRIELPYVIRDMVNSTCAGLKRGNQPTRSSEGSGGAYFMQDSLGHKYVSVFKPVDEEPLAINNPQGLPMSSDGEGLKRGTRVGEGALREVAAYILDHPKTGRRSLFGEEGFAGVPPTVMVRCLHEAFNHPEGYECVAKNIKIGSLQMFVKNCGSCEDMGPQAFPVEEVHKISVLDMRLANADRHAGNILMSKDGDAARITLIPIDHGYCLPENFEDCTFDWLYWPQARQPYAPDTIEYIRSLDAEEDIALLKFHGWDLPQACARILCISTMLLKKGVERGLTPYTIGSIMCRETLKKESIIEEIVREAQDSLLPGESEAVFLELVSRIMDCRLDKLTI